MSQQLRRGRGTTNGGPYGAANRGHSPNGRWSSKLRGSKGRGRLDGDEDLNMDASSSSRFNPYGKKKGNNREQRKGSGPNKGFRLIISGHKDGDWNDLLNFISRRTTEQVVVLSNPKHVGRSTVLTVGSAREAQVLAKLDGISYGGNVISIKIAGPTPSSKAKLDDRSVVDTLRAQLTARYNSEQRFLDLENFASNPTLMSLGIRAFNSGPGSQVGPVILKLIGELFPDVETLSVAKNKLRSLQSLASLSQRLPNLKNLSLKDNNISTYRDLEPLCGPVSKPKIKNLRELLLAGNPLRETEIKRTGDELVYRSEITRRFPSISLLDTVAVAPSVSFDIADDAVDNAPIVLPAPICTGFADSPVSKELATNFVRAYLEAYDNHRERLLDAYDPQASFSLNVCERQKHNRQRDEWSRYRKHSRNLQKLQDLPTRLEKLHVGNADIIGVIKSLPATSHSKMLAEPQRFCVDAWQLNGIAEATGAASGPEGHPAMFVHVHGEYEDVPSKSTRSFDRTFTLAPSVPGSSAQTAGWPVVILSDILTLRSHSGFSAWQPHPSTVPPAVPGVAVPPTTSNGLNAVQTQLAAELSRVTGLNDAFAVQCLVDNAWNYEVALARFNELKAHGVIPPEAFAK